MATVLTRLARKVESRKGADKKKSYTAKLFARGPEKCAEKFGEEAVEAIIACAKGDVKNLTEECADVLFHLLVMMNSRGVTLEDVYGELERREGKSGIVEKAERKKESVSVPKIYVIHRSEDEDRAAFVERRYGEAGLNYEFFYAIDGHNLAALQPYRLMIPDHFWGQNEIKPGALACFVSHQRAWAAIADGRDDYAIIAEDDSAPVSNFRALWAEYQLQIDKTDLLFLNNRTAHWSKKKFERLESAIENLNRVPPNDPRLKQAPGGDGYLLTKNAAQKLLDLSLDVQVICGVDWFLIGAYWKPLSSDVPERMEFEFVANEFAKYGPIGKAKICREPLFEIDKSFSSSIKHDNKLPISELKQNLISF